MKEEILDKRAAALRATLELISEHGFHGAPMSQIAERANIGVGTIYRYFASKEDLINALYIDVKTRLTRHALRNYSADMPVRESFNQLFSDIVRYSIENPSELSFSEQYENSPLITAATHAKAIRIAEPLQGLFQCAMEQNLLKELPFEMLSTLLSGAVISLAKLYISGKVNLDDTSLAAGIDAIWDMIKR